MSANTKELSRHQRLRNKVTPTHKFRIGAHVLHRIGVRSEKAPFLVMGQLPDGGAGLQYRVKGERDGVERVVTKSSIEPVWESLSFSPS